MMKTPEWLQQLPMPMAKNYEPERAYNQAKLACLVLAMELQARAETAATIAGQPSRTAYSPATTTLPGALRVRMGTLWQEPWGAQAGPQAAGRLTHARPR